jgi:hypothetical protein
LVCDQILLDFAALHRGYARQTVLLESHVELKLVRGVAADLTPADKKGHVHGRVGERRVRLHRDLSNSANAGDDVLIGGELHQDVVHVVALKNFTRGKTFKIDFTFHVLGAGFGACVAVFGLFFRAETTADTLLVERVLAMLPAAVGVAIIFVALRRVMRITRLTRWVESVDE